jgi:prepilin-type N-terminal cleavage/methylation domain-containing protein
MSRRAFTLPELIMATAVFVLVAFGSFSVYEVCGQSWRVCSAAMRAEDQATRVIRHVVHGAVGGNGLRAANSVTTNLTVSFGTNAWSITYYTATGGRYRFNYDSSAQTVRYTDLSANGGVAQTFGVGIIASSLLPAATSNTVTLSATAVARSWRVAATNTQSTVIHYRN